MTRAQLLKESAWLPRPNWWQGSTCIKCTGGLKWCLSSNLLQGTLLTCSLSWELRRKPGVYGTPSKAYTNYVPDQNFIYPLDNTSFHWLNIPRVNLEPAIFQECRYFLYLMHMLFRKLSICPLQNQRKTQKTSRPQSSSDN